tara:strand:- start:153 stop:383 length:231 start_codon:yes stop_codon:yes gene_type:complete
MIGKVLVVEGLQPLEGVLLQLVVEMAEQAQQAQLMEHQLQEQVVEVVVDMLVLQEDLVLAVLAAEVLVEEDLVHLL